MFINLLDDPDPGTEIEEDEAICEERIQEEAIYEERAQEDASRSGPGRPRIERTGRPGRPRKIKAKATYVKEENDFALLSEIPVNQAMASPESTEWIRAMADEVKSIFRKKT